MFRMKASRYLEICFNVLKRKTKYLARYPYNCGYYDGTYLYGDCWNFNPKMIIWAESIGEPIDKCYTVGKDVVDRRYFDGIKASGLGDWSIAPIMNTYCDAVSFQNLLKNKKAPALLRYKDEHAGAYIGEFQRDGKTYNVCEFTPNATLGDGLCPSYVDEYGRRLTHKNGYAIGSWTAAGYFTGFLDYDEVQPDPKPEKPWSIDNLAVYIMRGSLPDGTAIPQGVDNRAALFAEYGYTTEETQAAQDIVNEVYRKNKRDIMATEIAMRLIAGEGGDGVTLRRQWVADNYGDQFEDTDELFRLAQDKVNWYLE